MRGKKNSKSLNLVVVVDRGGAMVVKNRGGNGFNGGRCECEDYEDLGRSW